MSLDVQQCFLGWEKLMVWALYQKYTQNHIKTGPSRWEKQSHKSVKMKISISYKYTDITKVI